MRCDYNGETIPLGDEYYEINGKPVCIDHVIDYLNDWYLDGDKYVIGDEEIEEDDLGEFLSMHLERCDEEEEFYDPCKDTSDEWNGVR